MLRVVINWTVDRLFRAVHSISVGRLLPGNGRLVVESMPGDSNYSQVAKLALALIADGEYSLSFSETQGRLTVEGGPINVREATFFRIYRIEDGKDTTLRIMSDLVDAIVSDESLEKASNFVFENLWADEDQ